MSKKYLGKNVLQAARDRISYTFDEFENIYISLSGGKDSTVMFHLVLEEAIKRDRKIGLFFLDWECQFEMTIHHIKELTETYKNNLEVYWIALEVETNSSCSVYEPMWRSWDENKKQLWTREKDELSISNSKYFPFYYSGITFEEFTPLFGEWFSKGKKTASFVGIRAQESLNRWRAIARKDVIRYKENNFTTSSTENVWNVYPLYDWTVEDIWTYVAKENKPYNKVYDRMYQAGLKYNQMRIDEPFGNEARKNLWLYQVIEPVTWSKFTARMAGINNASLYSQERGNILGNAKVSLPDGYTWKSFADFLLDTMPPNTSNHYKNKITVYLKWYQDRGYAEGIPDEADYRLEQKGKVPAWRQIVKTLLKNDWYCQTLGFGVTKSSNYENYLKLMKKRRKEWDIFSE